MSEPTHIGNILPSVMRDIERRMEGRAEALEETMRRERTDRAIEETRRLDLVCGIA